jgi:hypothetical protein
MTQASNIRIDGVRQTIAALKAFTPDVEKVLGDQIRDALGATQEAAQNRYPRGSWVIGRNRKKLLGYIAARAGGKRAASWGDSAPGIRAGIFEFLGSTYGGSRPQVLGAIASLNARYGQPGRFLWSAWDESGQRVLDQIRVAVQEAEKKLQATLDAEGEAY